MMLPAGWALIEAEARDAFCGEGRLPLAAYSELMPAPHVVIKPYDPRRSARAATTVASNDESLDITEYEQARELGPGLLKIASHILAELRRLVDGHPHDLSSTLLAANPAWPDALSGLDGMRRLAAEPLVVALPLALSRTQDDKGNVRWTLFGVSHDGPSAGFWRSFTASDRDRFARFVGWSSGGAPSLEGVRVLAAPVEVPAFARELLVSGVDKLPPGVHTIVTFRPFEELSAVVRAAYLTGQIRLLPHPAGSVFFGHPGYRKLLRMLPRATQIPLLHLFPRVEGGYGIRIPQSGWLDEGAPSHDGRGGGHRLVHHLVRSHRWQRVARDHTAGFDTAKFQDRVSVALFSTNPDDLGLYGKPMARNSQIWNEGYALVLDGPRATPLEVERAAAAVDRGGRFGYRFYYPPMRAGIRELFWHRPLVARFGPRPDTVELFEDGALLGYLSAEAPPEQSDKAPITLWPRLLRRPGHIEAATIFDHDSGRPRFTTADNLRRLVEFREHCGGALPAALAGALTHRAKHESFDAWLRGLPAAADGSAAAASCSADLARSIVARSTVDEGEGGAPRASGSSGGDTSTDDLTFAETGTRAFEERLWKTIAALSEGDLRMKENADAVLVNRGRTGGAAARAARLELAHRRDLDGLGDHLHDRYRTLIEAHGMTGRAQVLDQPFRWETDFPLRWSEGWSRNQSHEAHERNIVLMIPGIDRRQAVIMADHYDTAYMEDVYEKERGGDGLRAAAAGADDNHSATAALLAAADVLLARSQQGKLARDVWLVHLTGEEFPADCLGARALAQALVERRLRFAAKDGSIVDVSAVRVSGVFVLDMVAHNNQHDRDIFQIAPGEGVASARLAMTAHSANQRWNRRAEEWNRSPERMGLHRAERRDHGDQVPPVFAHLPLHGEVRSEWDARSALYNTDGQIFSDVGIPVVLFMENYDINRTGYHDTEDTMKNIDLDYAAALVAIAIETVAVTASAS